MQRARVMARYSFHHSSVYPLLAHSNVCGSPTMKTSHKVASRKSAYLSDADRVAKIVGAFAKVLDAAEASESALTTLLIVILDILRQFMSRGGKAFTSENVRKAFDAVADKARQTYVSSLKGADRISWYSIGSLDKKTDSRKEPTRKQRMDAVKETPCKLTPAAVKVHQSIEKTYTFCSRAKTVISNFFDHRKEMEVAIKQFETTVTRLDGTKGRELSANGLYVYAMALQTGRTDAVAGKGSRKGQGKGKSDKANAKPLSKKDALKTAIKTLLSVGLLDAAQALVSVAKASYKISLRRPDLLNVPAGKARDAATADRDRMARLAKQAQDAAKREAIAAKKSK